MLVGCKAKGTCPYDCEKLYAKPLKYKTKFLIQSVWPQSRLMSDSIVTVPKLQDAMKTTRYGKCVFLCDNDVVDYQIATMLFENCIHSTLVMTAFFGPPYRETIIWDSLGELICDMGKIESFFIRLERKRKN